MAVFWNEFLSRFNPTSLYLQKVELDLNVAQNIILSLEEFLKNLRAKALSSAVVVQKYSDFNKRKITKKLKDCEKKTFCGCD